MYCCGGGAQNIFLHLLPSLILVLDAEKEKNNRTEKP